MAQSIAWYCSVPKLTLNRTVILRFRLHLESLGDDPHRNEASASALIVKQFMLASLRFRQLVYTITDTPALHQ